MSTISTVEAALKWSATEIITSLKETPSELKNGVVIWQELMAESARALTLSTHTRVSLAGATIGNVLSARINNGPVILPEVVICSLLYFAELSRRISSSGLNLVTPQSRQI